MLGEIREKKFLLVTQVIFSGSSVTLTISSRGSFGTDDF